MLRFFKLAEHNTTVGRELAAGLTTFTAMAYILAVNPAILMNGFGADPAIGSDPTAASFIAVKGALLVATAVSAALATFLMALEEMLIPVRTVILRGTAGALADWQRALAGRYLPATLVLVGGRDEEVGALRITAKGGGFQLNLRRWF